ncbi:Methyltransferase domain-containing protein [Marinospirillum celere]|uniref:Methyltransferase domain-containing protein n=1 Tax=Marinospirillum celere TaxID=1122252 RepID=A0A1I1E1H9_9GAMM|nr:class I SAM-dependent methyltransferase [Marinospirillum celere]SFB81031.1 Methyltransferase domain-containing protein [Marinospirillum celere]
MNSSSCPLCLQDSSSLWHTETRNPLVGREYWLCSHCDLVYVPAAFHLPPVAEQAIYLQHENNPEDSGYRGFLNQLLTPLLPFLQALEKERGSSLTGLDFGSGPGPTLALMLEEAGFTCLNYDPYFAKYPERLAQQYDFIVSTEVFEHLARPAEVMEQLNACLNPGGYLGIMTQRPRNLEAFSRWHYLMDPTHITFYSEDCFQWLASHWHFHRVYLGKSTILLRK